MSLLLRLCPESWWLCTHLTKFTPSFKNPSLAAQVTTLMEEARVEPAPSRRRKLSERLARSRHAFSEHLSNSRHAIAEQVSSSSNAVSQSISTQAQNIKTKVKTKMSNLTPRPIRALFFLVRWLKRLIVFVLKGLKVLLKTLWIILLFYLLCMVLLAIPFIQTQCVVPLSYLCNWRWVLIIWPSFTSAIFLHAITLPLYADFSVPEKYGLARKLELSYMHRPRPSLIQRNSQPNVQLPYSNFRSPVFRSLVHPFWILLPFIAKHRSTQ